ncbi:MAG: valine--tRNA ligase, partial [Patescibacteria group bacterium]
MARAETSSWGTGAYDPSAVEPAIYRRWDESGFFNPDNLPDQATRTETYVVYMPLPNVTGTLHMGHALDNTLPDVLIRHLRMKGVRTLWLPGTDHAGIATQYVVEKELKKKGVSRFELGREKFIERVWEWKRKYGDLILEQLKRLGCSADWSRQRFTMDEAYARDVRQAFVHYHEKGMLYRGTRTVNWCTRCGTNLSELELEYREEETTLWYLRYSDRITVATTRPETMLGDTAVAVNPSDDRYRDLVGTAVTLPLTGRTVPVVADQRIDPAFGTGAVKVTPAHDIADFEIGERHALPTIAVIDERGRMTPEAGAAYQGLTVAEARVKVVAALEAEGFLVKKEPYSHRVAVCYRCATAIEPIPSMQWFLKMGELARFALEAVRLGRVRIHPDNFMKPYEQWLGNIRDWAISRQIWWGHQLPVWFCETNRDAYAVALERPTSCPSCGKCTPVQSPDVLDTWFSSALWPFAGLSERDRTEYYPGNLVSNAREILNLWDTRMIFSGLEFKGRVPFTDILIHGTVLTKDGKRMSKSLGTGIDPMKYIETYGADATRFGVVWQASGQDIRWDEAAIVAGKKFANKVWNAAKFVAGHLGETSAGELRDAATDADRAVLEALKKTRDSVTSDLETFEFSSALRTLYDFFWHTFCDRYLEASKSQLEDPALATSTKTILAYVLRESLKLLHTF